MHEEQFALELSGVKVIRIENCQNFNNSNAMLCRKKSSFIIYSMVLILNVFNQLHSNEKRNL